MKYKFIEKKINYDGSELKSLYAYTNHQLHGESIISFIGACDVSIEHMVDAEDFVANAKIKADQMLHFIVEIFTQNLVTAVSLQRLLVSMAQNLLLEMRPQLGPNQLTRKGDDLYFLDPNGDKKLSVSIASCSAVSSMIHLGLNISNEGTPVRTCSLNDFSISPVEFGTELMKRFSAEYLSIVEATQKVRPLL